MEPKSLRIAIELEEFSSAEKLNSADRQLLEKARSARSNAYAPYSDFFVGAAVRLEDGTIVTGNNQENAAYPSGICAERTALFYAASQYPNSKVISLAISCNSKSAEVNIPLSPCGSCRQVISEYETRQESKIRILMAGESGSVLACDGIDHLLPLRFKGEFVRK
jgi:cytidine deaminase